jgi:hypothetical protein
MKLSTVLKKLRPGAEWLLNGTTYEGLKWMDTTQTKPTEQEIKDYISANSYKELRAKEYPSVTDQLDAIMKGGKALTDMKEKCMAVKAKYPKV